jgi:hypothetical protein
VVRLILFSANDHEAPYLVAAGTVAKSSVELVRKPATAQTASGKVIGSVESVVLGFIRIRLYVVGVETAIIHCCTSEPTRGMRTLPARVDVKNG